LRGLRQRFGQAGAPAVATAAAVAAEVGLGRFYETAARRSRSPESAAEGVHLEVLLAVAVGFATAVELLRAMDGAAEGEGSGDASGAAAPADAVALTTIHSTKGNEYANVVYFNLADEVAARPEEVEEERRVAYVAVTRAVDALLVTAPVSGYSRFVPELVLNPALQKTSTAMLAVRLWWLEGCRRWRARRGAEGRPDRPRDGDRGRIARLEAELGFRRQIGRRARRR